MMNVKNRHNTLQKQNKLLSYVTDCVLRIYFYHFLRTKALPEYQFWRMLENFCGSIFLFTCRQGKRKWFGLTMSFFTHVRIVAYSTSVHTMKLNCLTYKVCTYSRHDKLYLPTSNAYIEVFFFCIGKRGGNNTSTTRHLWWVQSSHEWR